jgi:rhodanese-related sulfurtransferase
MQEVAEITPAELLRRWPDGASSRQLCLLDVREPAELEIASVSGAVHIPMRQIPARLDQLARDKPIVVMCHSGARSRQVADFLLQQGFDNVLNLHGGIDAWSREVDPGVPRY